MNDYRTLVAFINTQTALVSLPPGETYRDLGDYFDLKLNNASNDRDDVKEMAKRALSVAGLDNNTDSANMSTLDMPANAQRRACGATVLAMSIIRDTAGADLQTNYTRLTKMSTTNVLTELRSLLAKGDSITSTLFPKLELKNFNSAGTRSKIWKHEIESSYGRTHELLLNCETQFLFGRAQLLPKVDAAFREYFGDPSATIDTSTLLFKPLGKPTFAPVNQTRLDVVREVMRRVCKNFVRQDVRIYFGGKSIDAGTYAYVSGKINPTRVHVGGQFFTKVKKGLGSEAGTIVHECTHTFSGTRDHAYRVDPCKALLNTSVAKALSNADSYKFFVETAFG